MNHLVIAVSRDSCLDLLRHHVDIIVLDRDPLTDLATAYESVYIRSHFSRASLQPQKFRSEIERLVAQAMQLNPNVTFVDQMSDVDAIIAFEDKWKQYEHMADFMPHTELLSGDVSGFKRPVFKNRLSSRGAGVTWDRRRVDSVNGSWIIQESLDIAEELRVYVVCGEIQTLATLWQSKTIEQNLRALDSRSLTQDETGFISGVMQKNPQLDFAGLDIVRTTNGSLNLIEVNRSPGFMKFKEFSSIDLSKVLYAKLLK